METFFYVFGGVLVLIALVISAIGMRNDDFPSPTVLRVGVLLVALVVGATAFGAVELSQEEEGERLAEENLEAEEEAAAETAENEATGDGEIPDPADQGEGPADPVEGTEEGGDTPAGAPVASSEGGDQVFVDNGCGGCHTLAVMGGAALGETGPNLDEALVDRDASYIETAIIDPSAVIAPGFGDDVMPSDFGTEIAPEDLQALVAYLQESTQEPAGNSSG